MAINFNNREKKTRQYLTFILILLILVFLIVLWQNVLKKPKISALLPSIEAYKAPQKIELLKKLETSFQILKNPIFQALQPYPEPSLPKQKIGRENPFELKPAEKPAER